MVGISDVSSRRVLSHGEVVYACPFCTCLFSTQFDLDLHLKAFGHKEHHRLSICVAVVSEDDGYKLGVDAHGDWRSKKSDCLFKGFVLKYCHYLVRKERSDESTNSDG